MKTISASTTTKIDSLHTVPIRVATWAFSSGATLNITDRVWNIDNGATKCVFNSVRYDPIVYSWGALVAGNFDAISKAPGIGQGEMVIDNGTPIFGSPRLTQFFRNNNPHFSVLTVYEFMEGQTAAGDLVPIYQGGFEDALNMDQPTVSIVFSGNELDISNRFEYEIVELATYPAARLKDVGKMLPQVWGSAQKVPFMGVSVGKVTTITVDIGDADTEIDITDEDGDFPSSGTGELGDEQISWTGKAADQLTGVTRGLNETGAASHTRGDLIQEIQDVSAYIIGHAVKAINNVYHADPSTGRFIRQLANVAKYTGQSGNEHASYPGKACLTFARLDVFIPDGGIIPFGGTTIPSGWAAYDDAIGAFIVGAGSTYAALESGGDFSVSMTVDSDGVHSGTAIDSNSPVWPGAGPSVPGHINAPPKPVVATATSGGAHDHDLDFEYVPDYQGLRLIKATGGKIEVPADGVLLSNDNAIPTGMSSVYTDEKFLRGTDVIVTLNPDDKHASLTLTNGDLTMNNGGGIHGVRGTLPRSSGKWYFEATADFNYSGNQHWELGVSRLIQRVDQHLSTDDEGWGINWGLLNGGKIYGNNLTDDIMTSETVKSVIGDIQMVAVDLDAGKIWHGRNGTWIESGDPASGSNPFGSNVDTGTDIYPHGTARGGAPSDFATYNFGAAGFAYAPPTGFSAWGSEIGAVAGVSEVVIEEHLWYHIHWTDPYAGLLGEGSESALVTRMRNTNGPDQNEWPNRHEHASGFTDETISENLKRAFVRAYTKASDYTGFDDAIIMYEGAVAPTGWVLCDGNNGTEDLRDYFIVLSNDATTAQTGDNTITPAMITNEDGQHDHISGFSDRDYVDSGLDVYHSQQLPDAGEHTHNVTTPTAYVPEYYALTFIQRTAEVLPNEPEPDQDALVCADIDGWQDDGSGTYTGTPNAIIERPDHISKHMIIERMGKTASEIDSTSYTASGSSFSTLGYREAVVVLSKPNPRMLLDRVAHQAKSMQMWEIGVHHLKYIDDEATVDKLVNQYRIDLRQLWITWTDRVDIKNVFRATYKRDWSGRSDSVEEARDVVRYPALADIATDPSVVKYGRLEGEVLSYPYIIDEAQAQDIVNWEYAEQHEARTMFEFVGGYWFTDNERLDLLNFSVDAGDWLEDALLDTQGGLVWQDRAAPSLFQDRGALVWQDRTGNEKYRIIEQSRRNDGAIQIKIVEVLE